MEVMGGGGGEAGETEVGVAIHPDCAIISHHLRSREVCLQTRRSEARNSTSGGRTGCETQWDEIRCWWKEEVGQVVNVSCADIFQHFSDSQATAVFIKDAVLFDDETLDHCSMSTGLYLHTLLALTFISQRRYLWCYILVNIVIFINVIRTLVDKLKRSAVGGSHDTGHFMLLHLEGPQAQLDVESGRHAGALGQEGEHGCSTWKDPRPSSMRDVAVPHLRVLERGRPQRTSASVSSAA
ncbi:hypothetical protein CRUP_017714 [Coryphaenoides rupestris]|nr:hypothetical protein CRUP_017714 [Coryphaenoides rupestris]